MRRRVEQTTPSIEVTWMTVTYRSIAVEVVLFLLTAGLVVYLISPAFVSRTARRLLSGVAGGLLQGGQAEAATNEREAHFVNLHGEVRVRKANSTQWVRANFRAALERGDMVQTGQDGMARIIFTDGTTYVLKPETRIVIEESRQDPVTRATQVAVQVTSGAVDLSTGRFAPGSTTRVSFENAVAQLEEESEVVVRNDPENDIHEISLSQGGAEVRRGGTSVDLGQYERATFRSGRAGLTKRKVIEPPNLTSPANLEPFITDNPKRFAVEFSWSAVPKAVSYHLKVSPSGMFARMVLDLKVRGTRLKSTGLEEGNYYWVVSAIDAQGQESQVSRANKFTLIKKTGDAEVLLEIAQILQHGKVLEVVGRTEPGSSVIINNEQVFSLAPDGTFRHFMSPVANVGAHQVSVTAQNRRGDVNTIRRTVNIQ